MTIELDPKKTALVLIDLQKGIISRDCAPYKTSDIVIRCKGLADHFRASGSTVVLVNVGWHKDGKDAPRQPVDQPNPTGPLPEDFMELIEGLRNPQDITITKRQWGAFHGTEMDLQLRRRGVETIVIAGVATNIGVESTARDAWEHGYALIFVEDACTTFGADMQDFAFKKIFPRLGRVTKSADLRLSS